MQSQKSNQAWPLVAAVVITALVVGGGMYFWQENQKASETAMPERSMEANEEGMEIWKNDGWLSYTGSEYEFRYPSDYTIEEPTDSFKALVIRGPEGSLEIFDTTDFAERPFGFTGEETQEEIDAYIPKETRNLASEELTAGPAYADAYEIWLFWTKGNSEVKDEIQEIANTIEVK